MSEYGERSQHGEQHGEEPGMVVRDRRRIDPQTGQVRAEVPDEQSGTSAPVGRHAATEQPVAPVDEFSPAHQELQVQLDERTADLQRLTAEYANYRKRVERDRELAAVSAKAMLAGQLLSLLDDIEQAAKHGDLTGAFKSVAEKLITTLQTAGLAPFGAEGEPFDPAVHEAVQHDTSPEVDGPTVTTVLRRGYRFGDRVVRAALVAVTEHEPVAQAPVLDEQQPVGESGGPTARE